MTYLDLPSPFKIFSSLSPPKKLFAKENAQFESLVARDAAYSSPPPKFPATPQPKEMSTSNKAKAKKCGPLAAFAQVMVATAITEGIICLNQAAAEERGFRQSRVG